MKAFKAFVIIASLAIATTACNSNRNQATLGSSQDTSNVNRAGGGPIADTTTINANRAGAKKDSAKKDTNAKGNVDPSGHPSKSNQKQ